MKIRSFAILAALCAALHLGCSGDEGASDAHDHGAQEGHDHGDEAGGAAGTDEAKGLAELAPEDRALAEAQETCPVSGEPLGSMGAPIKVMVKDRPVFLCCESCRKKLLADPDKYLEMLDR